MENHINIQNRQEKETKRILIIDDDTSMCKSIRALLSIHRNYMIEMVNDGETAQRILNQKVFDLIICDIKMPKKDGYEICLNMRTKIDKLKRTKIIGMSGYSGQIGRAFMESLGADCYFEKPFSGIKFRMKVAMLLGEN
jgi:DNA-binding response OmpR family regulator